MKLGSLSKKCEQICEIAQRGNGRLDYFKLITKENDRIFLYIHILYIGIFEKYAKNQYRVLDLFACDSNLNFLEDEINL